jgi:hypothetical protein
LGKKDAQQMALIKKDQISTSKPKNQRKTVLLQISTTPLPYQSPSTSSFLDKTNSKTPSD